MQLLFSCFYKNIYNPLKNQTVNDTLLTATKNGGKQNECYYICKKDSLKNIYLKNHEKQITEFIGSSGYTRVLQSFIKIYNVKPVIWAFFLSTFLF